MLKVTTVRLLILGMTLAGLTGCGSTKTSVGALQVLRGKAAIGAYMPEGSSVEVRGSAIDNLPSIVATATVDAEGGFTVDVSALTAPYLVRVQDAASGTWFYSYSDGSVETANANPYTDMLVRAWYRQACEIGGNPAHIEIDDVFTVGTYPNGSANVVTTSPCSSMGTMPDDTPIQMPNPTTIALTGSLLADVVAKTYLVDLENVLTSNWTPGAGFDSLLDDVGMDTMAPLIDSVLVASYFIPGQLQSVVAYSTRVTEQTGSTVTTSYQRLDVTVETSAPSVDVRDPRYGYETEIVPMSLVSTDGGVNQFSGSLQISSLPAEIYQLTLGGNTVYIRPVYYGTLSFALDGSVTSFQPGAGATVGTIGSGTFDLSVPDFDPVYVELRHRDSNVADFTTTIPSGTWTGTATLNFEPNFDFDLLVVGQHGERAWVRYQF